MAVCLIGVTFEAKMQMILLGVLSLSILNYWIGIFFVPVSEQNQWRGITGMNC